MTDRVVLLTLVATHLLLSGAIDAIFVWKFGHNPRAVASHLLLLTEWDVLLLALGYALVVWAREGAAWPARTMRILFALTCTLQLYLYALNLVSNMGWGRNMTGQLVAAFAPTIWSGKEPFPLGKAGITTVACGTFALMLAVFAAGGRPIDRALHFWSSGSPIAARTRYRRLWSFAIAALAAALFRSTLTWGIASGDNLFWTHELVAGFFRPIGYAFEPTARRYAVADRDALLQAAYPRHVPHAHRKNVVLIIVDSLRADRMQVYGYPRPTTPFLSELVRMGCMKRVEAAFSTCSESFCGITSILASREFRDISARTFQLQDVLTDEGYRTWFLLSGNHTSWNGLPSFYHAGPNALFDGTQTRRYTMDDDRLVLEGLEQVPAASPGQPAFFYFHLMSTHYLGVQFAPHLFSPAGDDVAPGPQPFKIANRLNNPDRYDDKIHQADAIIHDIFNALTAKHYLDDAVVVVTGDHGEGLGERHWAHGWDLYNEDIRIPMLVYDVPATTYPDLTFGAQVDIAPTILDRLELPIPSSWEGQSLLHPARERFTYHQTYFFPNRFAVLYRNNQALFKFVATPRYQTEELYDLRSDAGELHNLASEKADLTALLRGKVRAYREDGPQGATRTLD